MASKPVKIPELLRSSQNASEIYQLKQQIELDRQDKEQLESTIANLTEQLAKNSGEMPILLSLIDPDPDQPRRSFPSVLLEERAQSLLRYGQLSAIIVIPQDDGRYKLFDGEVRWRSAPLIGWSSLRAVLLPPECLNSNGETLEKQIITSLHSAKLNSLDLAEAIVKLARIQIPDLESDLVPKILNSVVHKLRKEKIVADLDFIKTSAESDRKIWLEGISFLTPQEKEFLKLLLSLQLHPDTTRLHVLPLLNYPDDLKEAIRQGLDVSKAKEIDRINPELGIDALEALEARRAIAKAVIEDNLTLSQTKAEVARTLERFSLVRQDPRSATSVRLSNLARKIKKITLNPDVEGKISNLLAEIESILAD